MKEIKVYGYPRFLDQIEEYKENCDRGNKRRDKSIYINSKRKLWNLAFTLINADSQKEKMVIHNNEQKERLDNQKHTNAAQTLDTSTTQQSVQYLINPLGRLVLSREKNIAYT